ncbi:MAG: hypothetical protein AAGG01_16505, partial [Planctomycetota bacterium]
MPSVRLAYLLDQLRRAKAAVQTGLSPSARAAAWQAATQGVRSGKLSIGTDAPIHGVPAWVTPRVLHGGFASGELAAEGPLDLTERALCARLELPRDEGVLPL